MKAKNYGIHCGEFQTGPLNKITDVCGVTVGHYTMHVGKLSDALITHVLRYEKTVNPDKDIFSINPVVGECNDSHLNDIRERVLGEEELEEAFLNAGKDFQEGAVGAGTGTICYGLKGGIGSASRLVTIDGKTYTLGILVQSNFGRTKILSSAENQSVGRSWRH